MDRHKVTTEWIEYRHGERTRVYKLQALVAYGLLDVCARKSRPAVNELPRGAGLRELILAVERVGRRWPGLLAKPLQARQDPRRTRGQREKRRGPASELT